MELKHCNRDACVAVWSNSKAHGQLLASASTNATNHSLYDLEILSVDLADPSKNLNVEGKSIYNVPYRCLAWGTFGEKQGILPYGIIFGGMQNGSFSLWNPADMIGKHDNLHESQIDDQKSFIYAEQAEQQGYPILCAEWNPLKNNFLAYGSTSLLILDVARDISSPDILKPSSKNPHEGSYITSVTWNKQVAHILASAGNDGLIALYDIKTNKSIFSFKDNSTSVGSRQVQIAWSKHISTQIAVTLDDEKKNQLQIWDLRNQKGPIVVIDKGHSKGINSMDWSELDHDLILTAGRDNKIICWNYKQDQEPLSTKQIQSQINKVAWSKVLPSIYSVTTNDGLSVYSLDDRNIHSYIPKWLKAPIITNYNGNDNLIIYSEERGNTIHQYSIKTKCNDQLLDELTILEEYLQSDDVEALKQIEGQTGQFWKLIATKRTQEGDSDIYDFLDLSKDKIIKQVQKYTGKKRQSISQNNSKASKQAKNKASKADYIPVSGFQAADFFGSLSAEPAQKSFVNAKQDENESQNIKYDMVPRNFNWDIGKEKLIKQNMLIGNYEGAIDAALKCGRTAEALIIAYSIDQTTFNSTLKTFFTQTTDNFISGILRHIAFKDSEELVKKYDINKWKECIALIFSLSSSDKRKALLKLLASRLQSQSEQHEFSQAVVYCYILAEEFQKIVELYLKRLGQQKANSNARKAKLVNLGTRLLAILTCMTTQLRPSVNFQRIVKELALVCLQANKKILSYTLLTKYVNNTSQNYVHYLIQNTAELAEHRNHQNTNVINLPMMNKRQEKAKRSNNVQQEVPTNIKPKQSKLPPKVISSFNEPEPDQSQVRSTGINKNKVNNNMPPPPPPPSHSKVQPIQITEDKPSTAKNNMPPPPPPNRRTQPFNNQQDEEETHSNTGNNQYQAPYNNQKAAKSNIPPPPPPPPHKSTNKTMNTSYEDSNSNAPIRREVPAPPENNPVSRPTFPSHNQSRTPPPPPPHKKDTAQEQHQEQYQASNTSNIKKNVPPPPPPPAIHQNKTLQSPTTGGQSAKNFSMPPPPRSNVAARNTPAQQQQYEDEDDEEQQQYQPPQYSNQGKRPPPTQTVTQVQPPVKKTNTPPPPPPVKSIGRVESQSSQQNMNANQEEHNTSYSKKGSLPPPPPPGRKNVPPPPPRR